MQTQQTESDNVAAVPTWDQRLEAHRVVERVRTLDAWPDTVGLLEDGIASTGLAPPSDPVVAALVLDDLRREVETRSADSGIRDHPEWPPCDPMGELTGREPMTRLLARRTDPDGSDDEPVVEGELPPPGGSWCGGVARAARHPSSDDRSQFVEW